MKTRIIGTVILISIVFCFISCTPNEINMSEQTTNKAINSTSGLNQPTATNKASTDDAEKQIISEDIWKKAADMPSARASLSAVALNGRIYAIGGETTDVVGLNTVEEYDPENNVWAVKASMPTKRSFPVALAVKDRIFVIGGESNRISLNAVEEYNPIEDKWITKKSTPVPCGFLTSGVVVGDKIFVLADKNIFLEYDPDTDTWITKSSPIDVNVISRSLCEVDGKIFAFGGDKDGSVKNVDMYDPVADKWTAKADMLQSKYELGLALMDGEVYLFGGYNEVGKLLKTVEKFNPVSNNWVKLTSMPEGAHMPGVVSLNGKVYILGGHSGLSRFNNLRKAVLVYDPLLDK